MAAEISKAYRLDMLTDTSVSVVEETFVTLRRGATPQRVGQPTRTSYVNSPLGREQIVAVLPEEYSDAVLAVWGDEPTLLDPPLPTVSTENSEPTAE